MNSEIKGICWKFGDDVNTDVIFPQKYSYKTIPEDMAEHVMEGIDQKFSQKVRSGDIIVAGKNFGCGSSMEHAPIALKAAGVAAIVATSFARIFYRNAISVGLPVVECQEASVETSECDEIAISLDRGQIKNLTTGRIYTVKPIPLFLLEILNNGGLIPHLKKSSRKHGRV